MRNFEVLRLAHMPKFRWHRGWRGRWHDVGLGRSHQKLGRHGGQRNRCFNRCSKIAICYSWLVDRKRTGVRDLGPSVQCFSLSLSLSLSLSMFRSEHDGDNHRLAEGALPLGVRPHRSDLLGAAFRAASFVHALWHLAASLPLKKPMVTTMTTMMTTTANTKITTLSFGLGLRLRRKRCRIFEAFGQGAGDGLGSVCCHVVPNFSCSMYHAILFELDKKTCSKQLSYNCFVSCSNSGWSRVLIRNSIRSESVFIHQIEKGTLVISDVFLRLPVFLSVWLFLSFCRSD